MWVRNLFFVGLLLVVVVALRVNLFPKRISARDEARVRVTPTPDVAAEVDRQFRGEWAEAGLGPAPRATDLAVLRRLALALTGAIPSLEEIRRFESLPADRRLGDWLDRTLRERRYTDYFAERLARAYVGTEGGPFIVYRRRRFVTWLSDELMANRPYDRMIRELIAGDGLWTDQPATNFVTVTYDPDKKTPDPERLAARTARAFLGVRLDCAQCHDHPFQPWKQADFQGLAAYYAQANSSFTGIHDTTGELSATDRKTGGSHVVPPSVPFRPELVPISGGRRVRLAGWVTHPENPNLSRATVNRVWALLFGRPLVEPVDDLPAEDGLPPVLTTLARDFVTHGFDLQRLIRAIAATEAFQLDSATGSDVDETQERAWAVFPLTRLRPEQVVGGIIQSASLETIDSDSHILVRLARSIGQSDFVRRYGDTGEDEFGGDSGTIPQRLLLMNGELVQDRTKDSLFNAAKRVGSLAPTDRAAVEVAYLVVLTRRPSSLESAHFEERLKGTRTDERSRRMSDLFWTLVNSTEFSWNH